MVHAEINTVPNPREDAARRFTMGSIMNDGAIQGLGQTTLAQLRVDPLKASCHQPR